MTDRALPQPSELEARVAALEHGLAAVLAQIRPSAGGPARAEDGADDAGVFWALDGLRDRTKEGDGGAVLFAGTVQVPTGERWEWQYGLMAGELIEEDWTPQAEVVAALGHPVRLRLLQAVLRGTRTAADLAALDEMGTTGQVYHHLRLLTAAGWLRASTRGHYSVPGERVVPLLIVLSAARR